MAEYLLSSQGDRMGMAHSVEGRFPFLDHRVMEFSNRLPPKFKMMGINEKYILKKAAMDLLPPEIWNRPKRPYRAPIHRSFFPDGQPMDWVGETLSPERIQSAGLFNPKAVTSLVNKVTKIGQLSETDNMALAAILSTQLIHTRFITNRKMPPGLTTKDDVKVVIRGN
jgi:asparagine synthase (glutamine-hydrolysing)